MEEPNSHVAAMEEPNSDDDCDLLAAFDAFEKQKASAVDYQCMAVIKPTGMSWHKGSRCMLVSNLDQNGYCVHHGHRHGCSDETKWRAPGPTPEYRPRPSVEESDAVYVLNGQKRIRAAVAKAQKCDVIRSRVAALLPQQCPSEATRSILFDEMAKDLLGAPSKARAAHYQPLANVLPTTLVDWTRLYRDCVLRRTEEYHLSDLDQFVDLERKLFPPGGPRFACGTRSADRETARHLRP